METTRKVYVFTAEHPISVEEAEQIRERVIEQLNNYRPDFDNVIVISGGTLQVLQ